MGGVSRRMTAHLVPDGVTSVRDQSGESAPEGSGSKPARRPTQGPGRRPLLDARGAGAYTGLGERYIRRLRAERQIACIRIGGRLLFDPDDLDRLIDRHRLAPLSR
jgi:hypothetical protein